VHVHVEFPSLFYHGTETSDEDEIERQLIINTDSDCYSKDEVMAGATNMRMMKNKM
jgi:hypothetical protein